MIKISFLRKAVFYFAVLVMTVITSCAGNTKPGEKKPGEKPKNILFIAVDDLKPLLGSYGDTIILTPHMDELASQGFVFTNSHCQQAVCAPSRASLLTGKRPDYTQVWDLKTLIRDKNPDIVTMPQYFKQKGYLTAATGKIFDFRSVDALADSVSWSYRYKPVKKTNPMGGGYVYETRHVSTEAPVIADSLTMDGEVLSQGLTYMKEMAATGKPFFLAVGFHKPHLPFVAPKRYWDLYDSSDIKLAAFRNYPEGAPAYAPQPGWELRQIYVDIPHDFDTPIPEEKQKQLIHGYYACVSFVDQLIGQLIHELDLLGIRENTVIVLWGDHGWHLGDHSMWCKHTNYEQATHAPLIFSGNNIQPGGASHTPVEFVDIYPTLCNLAGIPTPDNLDGVDLTPVMEGKTDKVKDVAVSQFPRGNKMGYAFRNERYRYVIWVKDFTSAQPFDESLVDAEELYDYVADPLEKKNLVLEKKYQPVRAEMKAQAVKFFNEQEKKLKSIEN